jgi:hypothetical protein
MFLSCLAHQNLDHITMLGKPIRVSFSKHQFVQMPKDGTSVIDNQERVIV